MNQIEGAINDLDKLTPNQHLLIIFGAQVVVQLGLALINYFGFTINPKTKANTMFQWLVNKVQSMVIGHFIKGFKMTGILEGKELEGKIGDVGSYFLDVEATGKVVISAEVMKSFEGGKISSVNKMETDLMVILEMVTKKTGATWDDELVAMIKKALMLVG